MTDIFREIDEDLRRDRYSQLLRRLAPLLIAAIVLILAGVGGWQAWRWFGRQSAEATGARFEQALQAARENNLADAEQALTAIAGEGPAGYRLLARLRLASIAGAKDAQAGAAAFTAIADDGGVDAVWRDLARLRATMLRIDTLSPDEAQAILQPLAAPGRTWRLSALETLGLAALQAGKIEDAGRWFDQILTDSTAPASLRQRVESVYMALVAGGPAQASAATPN